MMLSIIEKLASHAPKGKLRPTSGEFERQDLTRGLTTDMDHDYIRPVPDLIPFLLDPLAQVDLF